MRARLPAVLVASTLLVAALPGATRADTFDLGDTDKRAHVAVSYGITLTVAVVARRYDVPRWKAVALAAATTLVLGTTKELVDDEYSWNDQLANAIGITGAVGLVFVFRL